MKENIETKDVQRTEYLDKNGLDMLWAKVKENTHNQVEVEYNRAKAKEDSLSQEIASVKPDEDKSYIQAKLTSKEQDFDRCYYDVAGEISFKSEYSDSYGGPITIINNNGIGINFDNDPTFGSTGLLNVKKDGNYNITMQGNGRLLHDTRDTFNQVSIQLLDDVDTTYANSSYGNQILISQLGIFYTSQGYALTSNDLLTGHGGYKTIGTDITPLENGKVPAEYLDLSQYAKKSEISAGGNVKDIVINGESIVENNVASIDFSTKHNVGVVQVGDGLNVNPFGTISVDTTALTALQKKVADNTAAISGKQDAGNYITYEKRGLNEDRCYIIKPSYYIQCRTNEFDNGKYNYSTMASQYINVVNGSGQNVKITSEGITISDQGDASNEYHLSLSDSNISSRSNSASHSLLFSLNEYGVKLESGSDNEVLTSNASTIDITKYVLKSVYDEKIAALEARIAALKLSIQKLLSEIKTNVKKDFNV